MKRLMAAAVLLGSTFTGYVAAEDAFSANVSFTTDYRFRGISQTNRDPAVQGGFDWSHASGFYLGGWGSNVSFTDGGTEFDFYGGWGTALSESVALDMGVIYYAYPSDPDADYVELQANLGFFGATVGLNYSPEYTYDTGTFFYLYGAYSLPLGDTFTLDFNLGLNQFKGGNLNSFLGTDPLFSNHGKSFIDYSISGSTNVAGLDLTLAFVGTDIDKDDCFPSLSPPDGSGDKACRGNLVFSISKSF